MFEVTTNLPNDTTKITERIAEYIAEMIINQYDCKSINLLIDKLTELSSEE